MDEQTLANIYQAYNTGIMSAEESAEYEADVNAGAIALPQGAALRQAQPTAAQAPQPTIQQPTAPQILPSGVVEAYFANEMTLPEKKELEADVQSGLITLPEGVSTIPYDTGVEQGIQLTIERGVGEVVTGLGEAALTLGTGATTGSAAWVGGVLKGLAENIRSGKYGTEEGARLVEKTASDLMQEFTYAPRTEAGLEYVEAAGEVLAPLEALTPAAAEIGAVTRGVRQAMPAIGRKPTVAPKAKPTAAPTPEEPKQVGELVNKAARGGMGSAKAKEQLAEIARVNPEAKMAADRLDIELPADVWSDSQAVKEAAGLTRSVAGSEVSAAWRDSVIRAADKADDAIRTIDASTDVATISNDVISALKGTRESLYSQAKDLYKKVDDVIPKKEKVEMNNLMSTLVDIMEEVGDEGLSTQEKKLLSMIDAGDVTYGRLLREKSLIGKALENRDSPYGNMDSAALKRLYGAIKEDQLSNVEMIGSPELRGNLKLANQITAKQKALEKRVVNAFGSENEGSIASLMRRSITQGEKGDITALNKLLKVVPKELQKETIATALMSATRAKSGITKGEFGFSEFANTYRGMRNNAPVYNKVVTVLGEGIGKKAASDLLTDLYTVSKRVTDARANVLTTGKANQAILNAMNAERLTNKIMNSTIGKATTTGVAATAGGPVGATLASGAMSFMQSSKKAPLEAAGRLFRSKEFNKLATEAATKKVSNRTVKQLVNSGPFKKWQKASGAVIDNPELWILETFTIQEPEENK